MIIINNKEVLLSLKDLLTGQNNNLYTLYSILIIFQVIIKCLILDIGNCNKFKSSAII